MTHGSEHHIDQERQLVDEFNFSRLTPELAQKLAGQTRSLHLQEWRKLGLCADGEAPESRADLFNQAETFVLIEPKAGELIAQIHTLPIAVYSMAELCQRFPTYHSVVETSMNHHEVDAPATHRICFSITSRQDIRLVVPSANSSTRITAPATVLLRELAMRTPERKIAYSRFGAVPEDCNDLVEFYLKMLREQGHNNKARRALGAVGMHEHLGGITRAIIMNGRPEDVSSAGANILVEYPQSTEETKHFLAVLRQRIQHGVEAIEQVGPATIFQD